MCILWTISWCKSIKSLPKWAWLHTLSFSTKGATKFKYIKTIVYVYTLHGQSFKQNWNVCVFYEPVVGVKVLNSYQNELGGIKLSIYIDNLYWIYVLTLLISTCTEHM